jgi:4'-phosphopantetheinyl transferase
MSAQTLVLRHAMTAQQVCFAAVNALPAEDFLGEDEKLQFAGFQFAAKKDSFLLGRLAAKRALGALINEPDLRRIEIRAGVYGQPLIEHPRAGRADVAVSHSHGLAVALAFPAAYPMGIDLETVAAASAATILGEMQASPAELAWLVSSGVDEATACFVLWTAREALGKALKIGINSPLGILALAEIQAAGERKWAGRYLNFPQCRCLSQARGDRVLSLALPKDAELVGDPRLP